MPNMYIEYDSNTDSPVKSQPVFKTNREESKSQLIVPDSADGTSRN